MFEREKSILKGVLGSEYDILKAYNIMLAGGAITSVFTNKPINDFDMYFRDVDTVRRFYTDEVISGHFKPYYYSHKAATLLNPCTNQLYQIVCCDLYNTPEDIFKSFDFTLNMGAYDFKTEEFVLHPDFLLHNAQRKIHINKDTKYPIASLVRIQKYMERGYKMTASEWFRMAIILHQLNVDSWETFEDGLSGAYGEEVRVSNDITSAPFSWDNAMGCIDNLQINEVSQPERSNEFVSLPYVDQLRLIMANFDYTTDCIRLGSNRNNPNADIKYDLLRDTDGRIFLQPVDGRYEGLNVVETTTDIYPLHVFRVVRKNERGRYRSIPRGNFTFIPGEIVESGEGRTPLMVYDAQSLNTSNVGMINDTTSNVILHLQINSPDWFSYRRGTNATGIVVDRAFVIGELSFNEFRIMFRGDTPESTIANDAVDDFSEMIAPTRRRFTTDASNWRFF